MFGELVNEFLDALTLARWQFGLTTLYHFLFVPLTIGLSFLVAILQTAWVRTGKVKYLRLTKLYGKVFLINFAMGVVTGIVQEFQFGMNWSNYSRFVGDIFGAPLAMEGLIAFFLEATFIGLWIFGWDKLPKRVHLATIWATSIATMLSAYFILAANAFMQNPVGYKLNPDTQRAELTDIVAVLTNPVALWQFPHTIFASVMFGATVMVAVAAWHLKRNQYVDEMRASLRFGLWANILAFMGVGLTGHSLGMVMTETQPMKMAAAEALYANASGADASFSIFSLGTPDGFHEIFSIRIPYLLSFLSNGDFTSEVEGINNLQAEYAAFYCGAESSVLTCPSDGMFMPIIWVTYWSHLCAGDTRRGHQRRNHAGHHLAHARTRHRGCKLGRVCDRPGWAARHPAWLFQRARWRIPATGRNPLVLSRSLASRSNPRHGERAGLQLHHDRGRHPECELR